MACSLSPTSYWLIRSTHAGRLLVWYVMTLAAVESVLWRITVPRRRVTSMVDLNVELNIIHLPDSTSACRPVETLSQSLLSSPKRR